VEEVYEAVADLQAAGFENFNLDLIFGLPYQTLEHWQQSLRAVLEINPTHVSVYDLTIEPGTRFGRMYRPGAAPLPSEETTVAMYLMARELLTEAGYIHYENLQFCPPRLRLSPQPSVLGKSPLLWLWHGIRRLRGGDGAFSSPKPFTTTSSR
jgi:coproporphyrinogen III oxidase-like Fe-S oxidoreductase